MRLIVRSGIVAVTFAVAALTLAFATAAESQAPLRLASFNIRYGTASDGDHAWPNRRDAVVSTIRDHAPHVLGVQEALRFQLDEIGSAFVGYAEFGVGRNDGITQGEYAAIFVDTLRLRVLASGTFWLSDTPDVPGSVHWGNRITRITTWARVVDQATGDTLRIYNLHWDHESQPSRERAAEQLVARIEQDGPTGDGVIVMGDFNSDEENPAFQRLVSPTGGLRDTFRAIYPDAGVVGTFNAFRGDSTGGKIDAVLVGPGWDVLSAGIDRRRFGELWASDHFLVWSALKREPQGGWK